jgi:glutathione S-transferase
MLRAMGVRLYAVPASHPCAAVEAALELKGIAHRRVDLVPALHKAVQRGRFGAGTVPGVVLEDGRKVLGSRAIVRALEALQSEPPLLPPAGTDERRRVEEAEQWGDEVLQPVVRRILWQALSVDRGAQLSYLDGARLVPPTPRAVARLSGGAVAWLERRFNDVSTGAVRADLAHLPRHLDRVDRWIAEGVIGGERPNAADLQIGSGLRLLLTLEDLAPMLDARPAGALARRWFPRYPGRTPAGALDPAWLP